MGALAILGNTGSGEPVMAAGLAIPHSQQTPWNPAAAPDRGPFGPSAASAAALFRGGPVAAFEGEVAAAAAGFFTGRFEARVPQRILSGTEAAAARFAEGCVFAGAISSIAGESEL